MTNEPTYSRDELDDRIAILRDNIRQLTEQAAAVSGAGTEALIADRISAQQAELDRLTRQRDELMARMGNAPATAPAKKAAKKTVARKAVKKAPKKAAPKKKPPKKRAKKAGKAAKKKAAARKPAKKTKKAAKKKKK